MIRLHYFILPIFLIFLSGFSCGESTIRVFRADLESCSKIPPNLSQINLNHFSIIENDRSNGWKNLAEECGPSKSIEVTEKGKTIEGGYFSLNRDSCRIFFATQYIKRELQTEEDFLTTDKKFTEFLESFGPMKNFRMITLTSNSTEKDVQLFCTE